MIDVIIKWADSLLAKNAEARSWFLSFVMVPGAIIGYLISGLTPVSPFSVFEDSISVTPILMEVRPGIVERHDGFVVILDSNDVSLSLPWSTKQNLPPSLLMSIDLPTYNGNLGWLSTDRNGLRIRQPLLGQEDPVVIVAIGSQAGDVLIPGKRLPLKTLALTSRKSISLALWATISSMFGIGLTIGIGRASVSKISEDGTGNEGTEKNED
jgi:hypothetical protein